MKTKKILVMLSGMVLCYGSLQAVQLLLPFPIVCKRCLSKTQENRINLRDFREDIAVESTECSYTKVPFDELFDEAVTSEIVIGTILTEDKEKVITHYFDGCALMRYVLTILQEDHMLENFTPQKYQAVKNSYKNMADPRDNQVYVFEFELTEHEKSIYHPLFVNPVNRKPILSIHFFKVRRENNDDATYTYKAFYMGIIEEILLSNATRSYFKQKIEKNIPWQEKLITYLQSIKKLLEYMHEGSCEALEQEYERLCFIIETKKLEIERFRNGIEIVDKEFLDKLDDVESLPYFIANKYFECGYYTKALPYYEKMLNSKAHRQEALHSAALIRLGHMKDAAIEEQLKGIDYYEKYLEIFKETNKRKWVYSVIELAELLYDRAETSEDYVPIVSCLQAIEDYNSYRYTRHKSLLLMGKIYFKEGKFGLAQSYLQNIIQDNRKHLFSHYQATYYLTRIDELLEKKDMQMICNGYKNICNGVFNNFLKALAAQSWAQALFKLYQEKNFDEQKIGLVQRIFQQAQFHYEAHLKNTSTINDYHKCSIANALREIHNQLEMLKKMQSEQSNQKTFSLSSVVKKRSAEQELTQSLKRRKEK